MCTNDIHERTYVYVGHPNVLETKINIYVNSFMDCIFHLTFQYFWNSLDLFCKHLIYQNKIKELFYNIMISKFSYFVFSSKAYGEKCS